MMRKRRSVEEGGGRVASERRRKETSRPRVGPDAVAEKHREHSRKRERMPGEASGVQGETRVMMMVVV